LWISKDYTWGKRAIWIISLYKMVIDKTYPMQ
jgi:hypothetical protein